MITDNQVRLATIFWKRAIECKWHTHVGGDNRELPADRQIAHELEVEADNATLRTTAEQRKRFGKILPLVIREQACQLQEDDKNVVCLGRTKPDLWSCSRIQLESDYDPNRLLGEVLNLAGIEYRGRGCSQSLGIFPFKVRMHIPIGHDCCLVSHGYPMKFKPMRNQEEFQAFDRKHTRH